MSGFLNACDRGDRDREAERGAARILARRRLRHWRDIALTVQMEKFRLPETIVFLINVCESHLAWLGSPDAISIITITMRQNEREVPK